MLQLGVALCLGCTDLIQTSTVQTQGLRRSYKNTFWFAVAAAGVALVLMAFFVHVPRARSALTADEKGELEREATMEVELEKERSGVAG